MTQSSSNQPEDQPKTTEQPEGPAEPKVPTDRGVTTKVHLYTVRDIAFCLAQRLR
jgi:hypothetical protein